MTAKEELSQYECARERVEETLEEYEKYKERAEKMTAIRSDMPKGNGGKSDKVGGFSMIQKQAYEQLRLQLLFLAEDDVVRTSNFIPGTSSDEDAGEGSGTTLPPIFD